MRISHYFGLAMQQPQLQFVDVRVDHDLPLFLDPYALKVAPDAWSKSCTNLVLDFFQRVLDTVRNGERARGIELLQALREPNETHLGLSKGTPDGRGVGTVQGEMIFDRIANSKAFQTGLLTDLSDCELMIPGISSDKVSDMVTNIIREPLLIFTREQCELHGIPTQEVAAGACWSTEEGAFVNKYASMPIINDTKLLLVPKNAVRYSLELEHDEFYSRWILNYLQQEHLKVNSGLVKTFKNGRRVVTKKSLQEQFPLSKEYVANFIEQHPEIFDDYKDFRKLRSKPLADEDLEARQAEPEEFDFGNMIATLRAIEPGIENASRYHNEIVSLLNAIFYPQLINPKKEQEINDGLKRIDITYQNANVAGFFKNLADLIHLACPFIFVECKNYSNDVSNPEIDQLSMRLSPDRGMFGILVCRQLADAAGALQRCRDVRHSDGKFIVILTDEEIGELVERRADQDMRGINDIMNTRLRELVM